MKGYDQKLQEAVESQTQEEVDKEFSLMMDILKKGEESNVSIIKRSKDLSIYRVAQHYGVMPPAGRWGYSNAHESICCPFHDDNNPSCTLWPSINAFKCWSCGAKGDVINFIHRMENTKKIPIYKLKEFLEKYEQ